MSDSRKKILDAIKKGTSISALLHNKDRNLDERIKKNVVSITPRNSKALQKQFKQEVELVSGEYHQIGSTDEATELVSEIVNQNNYKQLTVTEEKLCKKIANKVVAKNPNLEIIHALELNYPERKTILAHVSISLVTASYTVADTGSLVFLYDDCHTCYPHFLADCVIVIAKPEQIVPNQFELFEKLPKEKAKNMVFVSGPSRTADIEKVLILGAHGPRRLIIMMFEK